MSTTDLDRALHTQVLKREATKEKAFRDERQRLDEEFHAQLGMGGTEMTQQELRKIIDGDRRMYYRTEELNDKLYIHYKGWRELKSLEGWTGLRSLYAECNAFSEITGLQNCRQLRSLFLQENCIQKISGLENCPQLWSLNLSKNFISRIEGLEKLTGLNTLIIAGNKIGHGGLEDVEKLVDSTICTCDIQDNKIDDPDVLPEVFARMPDLRVLYLKGNPAAKKIVNYRKSCTVYCKDLKYLDDRPVFADDRRQAEAFNRGGIEEQRAETKRIKQEERDRHDRNMRLFQEMIEESKRAKREKDGMRAEDKYTDDTDPVDSYERRCRRAITEWKEEHKEELKDDMLEYAQKCLREEREGKAAVEEDTDDQQKATTESRDTATESGDTGAAESEDTSGQDPPEKVDNRKLVYDDIWDDVPGAGAAPQPEKKVDNRKLVYDDIWDDTPAAPATSVPAVSPSGPPASLGPASGGGVFLPWADGAIGMDAVAPSQKELERRKAALNTKDTETGVPKDDKPSWHSKYLEKVEETQSKLGFAPKPRFAPPSRTSETPAAPAAADVVRPEPKATSAPSQGGAGELDEMD